MNPFKRWRTLKKQGVVGINQRNLDYISPFNPRHLYPLVDNKIKSKELAEKAAIPVPQLYGVIATEHQTQQIEQLVAKFNHSFVIKPAHGAGGDGILIITGKSHHRYRKSNGFLISSQDISYHLSCILSGIYSLGGLRDVAMIEYRVLFDPLFESISYQGVPDVRIIVFCGFPIMAMVRLPTRQSDGKANLHQGAVGVGVDIATGCTQTGVWYSEQIATHPDTGNPVAGLTIPNWDDFLTTAARCYELTGLGYLGVDIVLDKNLGPLMLELNARPGLNIQIANNCGLNKRTAMIASKIDKSLSVAQRVQVSKRIFAQ